MHCFLARTYIAVLILVWSHISWTLKRSLVRRWCISNLRRRPAVNPRTPGHSGVEGPNPELFWGWLWWNLIPENKFQTQEQTWNFDFWAIFSVLKTLIHELLIMKTSTPEQKFLNCSAIGKNCCTPLSYSTNKSKALRIEDNTKQRCLVQMFSDSQVLGLLFVRLTQPTQYQLL